MFNAKWKGYQAAHTEQQAVIDELKAENERLLKVIDLAGDYMAFHCRDWGNDHRDAAIYSLLIGWDEASMLELKGKHNWPSDSVPVLMNREALQETKDNE